MLYHNILHVAVHQNHHWAPLLKTFKKKHKYVCDMHILR